MNDRLLIKEKELMKITATDLIYLDKAAKALKQKTVIIYNYKMYGLDMIDNYITYIDLYPNNLSEDFIKNIPIIIISQQLSRFVKTITNESYFTIYDKKQNILHTIAEGSLFIVIDNNITNKLISKITQLQFINNYKDEVYLPEYANQLYNLHAADGAIQINVNDHIMYVFPTFLPCNKDAKLYCSIYDIDNTKFISKFRLEKNKFNMYVVIAFLRL